MRLPNYYQLPDGLFDELLAARSSLHLGLERALDRVRTDEDLLRAFAAHDTALHKLMLDTDLKRKRSTLLGLLHFKAEEMKHA